MTAILLAVVMLFGMQTPAVGALELNTGKDFLQKDLTPELTLDGETENETLYADDETVRVSIVLADAPTIAASYALDGIAANEDAMAYRHRLKQIQELVIDNIETYALDGEDLDVAWNLTLVANVISANVEYGKIDEIAALDGVVDVFVEAQVYPDVVETDGTVDPTMLGSSAMSGSSLAHASGYTGAGSRIAIIDTGIDTDHRSFNADAFEYSLHQLEDRGLITIDSLDLMTVETIEGVLSELNISDKNVTAEDLYLSSKLPFAVNYTDLAYGVDHHKGDGATEHGSHVAGIAAANTYVPDGAGGYLYALDAVEVCGTAPDAQILTLRVFNRAGGCYESDYMVAIEDAILLGADSINLSLGSAGVGFTRSKVYADILNNLVDSGTVCVASAGNNGAWGDGTKLKGLLAEDVNMFAGGEPASYAATVAVGSVDNANAQESYFTVDGQRIFYHTASGTLSALTGSQAYVYLPEDEVPENIAGKIAVCERGGALSMSEKANRAAEAGALAVILVNNVDGALMVELPDYSHNIPVVTVTKADGALLKNAAEHGALTVAETAENDGYYTMSFFSSFGVPGNLTLSPDIAAPGGSILSVNGSVVGGQAYEVLSGTSMAGPQVAGMSAALAQYIKDKKLTQTGYTAPFLIRNLLMSTAVPFKESENQCYYPVMQQGSGLANLDHALSAQALILTGEDGKVKAEFGDDPARNGVYSYEFTIQNFSGKQNTYTLSTEMFTQGLRRDELLSNGTTADFLDNSTIPLPAKATYTVDGAEIDGDLTVTAYGSVTVSVEITLTETEPLEDYPNGAYVEGYTFIKSAADAEGVRDVNYSIPLLGFYGRWSDASMYDHATYAGRLYGEETLSYVFTFTSLNNLQYTNYLNIVDSKTGKTRIYTGNPYAIAPEIGYKTDRGAIRSTDIIYSYTVTMIRSAGAGAVYLTDADDQWLTMGSVRTQIPSVLNYKGTWTSASSNISFNRTPAELDLPEGTTFHVNLVTVPEYYETNGNISASELKALIQDEKLGDGAYLSTTLTVDDTKPKITEIKKDDKGNLTVTASDNQYIAYMCVTNRSGSVVYDSYVPNAEKGAEVTHTFHLEDMDIGPTCRVFVGDYAENEEIVYFDYKGEYPALEGNLGGYVHDGGAGYKKSWVVLDPSDMANSGAYAMQSSAYHGGDTVTAAAYVDGYVYQVIGSKLYTSPIAEIDDLTLLVDLERFRLHSVHALSYNLADNMLYALTDGNNLWRIDPKNGRAEPLATLTVSGLTGNAGRITAMAIDNEGHFYGITYYETSSLFLKWELEAIEDKQLTVTGERLSNVTIRDRFGSMTYDRDEKVLYLAESYNDNTTEKNNRLLRIDPAAMTAVSATLGYAVRGLFAVPVEDEDTTLAPTEDIVSLDILPDTLEMLVTGTEDLSPLITPWTAEDKTLNWSTTNDQIVAVKNGVVTAIAAGKATVTVTTASGVSDACEITVSEIPDIEVSALVYGNDKAGHIASYKVAEPQNWNSIHDLGSYAFVSGGLSNGTLYVHDGGWLYTIDPETYAVTQGPIFAYLNYVWSDATQAPKNDPSLYRDVTGLSGDGTWMGTYSAANARFVANTIALGSPAAAVAYVGEAGGYEARYYVLLENGALYDVLYPSSPLKAELLGVLPGVDLTGVSEVNRSNTASLLYDKETDYLVLTRHADRSKATVQLIDPKTVRVMSNTDFGEDVWYAAAQYQYDPTAQTAEIATPTQTTPAFSEKLQSPFEPQAQAEEDKAQTHSVYEGLEKLVSATPSRLNATADPVARLESTGMEYPTLQAAIDAAHAQIVYGDHAPQTVTLLADTTESVRNIWIKSRIDYDYELTVDLNGHTVTGTGDGPVLWFEASGSSGAKHSYRVTVNDNSLAQTGTITGGTGRERTFAGTSGGGIYFSAATIYDTLTVNGGRIEANTVTGTGGAIAMDGSAAAELIINGGSIRGNSAENGAVFGRWITVNGGEITANQAGDSGGGLCLWGTGTQELKIGDAARVYGNRADTMGDDVAAVSMRGSADYAVRLNDPSDSEDETWYADGVDGPYEHGMAIKRYDPTDPESEKLHDLTVRFKGSSAPAYGIAASRGKSLEAEAAITGVSLSLGNRNKAADEGDIVINFYLNVPALSKLHTVALDGPNGPKEIAKTELERTDNGFRASYPVYMKDFEDTVSIDLLDEDGKALDSLTYSVADYIAATKITSDAYALVWALDDLCRLVKAQIFETETDVTVEPAAVDAGNDAAINVLSGYGVDYYGSSLLMKDRITIRHYFKFDDPTAVDSFTVLLGDEVCTLKPYETGTKYFYMDVMGISATELATKYTVKLQTQGVDVVTVNYGVLSYANKVLAGSYDALLTDIANALYAYYDEAVAFFYG